MGRYKINYDEKRDCFESIKNISSELVWGDLDYISDPFFTYTIPAYKRAYLLRETLYSVLNQLPVDFQWDIIVVDNEAGTENGTEQVIKELNNPRILYYRNTKNIGVDGNYNRCIELARGQWLAMLHADDLVLNDHLQLMGEYIRMHERDRVPLAYISPQYVEFSKREEITLRRTGRQSGNKDFLAQKLLKESYRGRPKRFRQIYGAISGSFVSLPSFGTVMRREILLKEGGFNENLGVCEDVITPYKLAEKYGVYKTPKVMGYYRFENNESMKKETILKIYTSMVDFREYMYSRNFWMKIWGKLARNELNCALMDYCIQMSRFNEQRLKKSDFFDIYTPKRQNWFSLKIFQFIMRLYKEWMDLDTFEEVCYEWLENLEEAIQKRMEENNEFIIYGAGKAGKCTIKYLRKHFSGINILCVAVSAASENVKKFEKLPVRQIDKLKKRCKTATVITAVTIQQYQDEMNRVLKLNGFSNVINLLTEIRSMN